MKKKNTFLLLGCSLIVLIILFSFSTLALENDFATANQVNVNSPYSDNISGPGDENYYRFYLSTPGSLYLDFKHKNVYDDTELWNAILYNEKIEEIASYSFKGNEERSTTCVIGLDKGTYFLKIKGSNHIDLWENKQVVNTSVYTLTLKFSKSNYYEKENNESFSTSTHITPKSIFYGSLNDVWDCDYYDFEIKETGIYNISFNHPCIYDNGNDEYFEVRLYNNTGKEIKYISSKGNTEKTDETISLEKGKYFLRIGGGYSYCGHLASQRYSNVTYNFGIIKIPSKVGNLKSTQTTSAVTLNWNAAENATVYKIYQKVGNDWKSLGDVTGTSKTIKSLKAGTKYTFAVKAGAVVDGKVIWSDVYTTINTATKAVKPAKVTSAQNDNAIKLTWTKCAGATGYRIYYRTSTKADWKVGKSTTTATSHTFSKLKPNQAFQFAVRPYTIVDGVVIWSDYTTITASTTPATPTAKVTSPSKGKVILTWNAVSGATGYQVYYKVGNGSWKLYKTVAKPTTYTFSNLKSGTKYTFAVRAYRTVSGTNFRSGYKAVSVTIK